MHQRPECHTRRGGRGHHAVTHAATHALTHPSRTPAGLTLAGVTRLATIGHGLTRSHDLGRRQEAVDRVLADQSLAQRLGRAARTTIEEQYSWRALVNEYEQAYEAVLTDGPDPRVNER